MDNILRLRKEEEEVWSWREMSTKLKHYHFWWWNEQLTSLQWFLFGGIYLSFLFSLSLSLPHTHWLAWCCLSVAHLNISFFYISSMTFAIRYTWCNRFRPRLYQSHNYGCCFFFLLILCPFLFIQWANFLAFLFSI